MFCGTIGNNQIVIANKPFKLNSYNKNGKMKPYTLLKAFYDEEKNIFYRVTTRNIFYYEIYISKFDENNEKKNKLLNNK